MEHKRRIVIDEGIPDHQLENIASLLKRRGIKYSGFYLIAKEHRGIPDYQIIHLLLNESTLLFTTDRPLHNTVIAKGLLSFYFNGDSFSPKALKGIRTIKLPSQMRKDLRLKDCYHEPKTEIRHLILPKSEKGLKKLRTKRRRIRSYFGGVENMEQVAITVSYRHSKPSTLVGVRIKISSKTGRKALDASESYIGEKVESENSELLALNHSLIPAVQLMLNHVKTVIYYDTQKIQDPKRYLSGKPEPQSQLMFNKLVESFSQIEFVSSAKGFFIERLRRKLDDIAVSHTNEIVHGRIREIENEIAGEYLMLHSKQKSGDYRDNPRY